MLFSQSHNHGRAYPRVEQRNCSTWHGVVFCGDFSMTVNAGECVVLHGENGIGKSTIIETAARLLPIESGSVKHHGKVVCDGEGRRVNPAKPFGLTLQKNCLVPSQTVQQQVENVIALSGKSFDCKSISTVTG